MPKKFITLSIFSCVILSVFIFVYRPSFKALISFKYRKIVPPYLPSAVIKDVIWEISSLKYAAPGSDLWPITWAGDDNLYTAWGDGGGFAGTNRECRVSLGVGCIENTPEKFAGINIFGGKKCLSPASFDGKPSGLIFVNDVLYMGVVEQGKWMRWKVGRSDDYGRTWSFNGNSFNDNWDFSESDGAFSGTTFLQFGKNYFGSRDEYVYAYSQEKRARINRKDMPVDIALFRVNKENLMNRDAYEYFAGLDLKNNPIWTKDIKARRPVFTDPNGVGWGARVVYNPGIKRYLLTTWHSWDGSWGVFDAPEPWGPWTTVVYYNHWLDDTPKFGFSFPQKWMSTDGKTMWMVFSGTGKYDSFNLIKVNLMLRETSDTNKTE